MIRRDRCSRKAIFLLFCLEVFVILEDTYGISVYTTPASDMEFNNFEITNRVPEDGSGKSGDLQERVYIEGTHIIFQFKGLGNALILFRRNSGDSILDSFLVEIGGGRTYSEVNIYDSTAKDDSMCKRRIPNITSVSEYRYFWISWIAHEMRIQVGTGNTLNENEIISGNRTELELRHVYLYDIVAIYISTTSSNNGYWRFNIPATGIPTAFIQRSTVSMAISVTDAPTPQLTSQTSALKTEHIITSDFVHSANTVIGTQALSHTNRAAASKMALITIPYARRTDFPSGTPFSKAALDLLTVDSQTSVEIALITNIFVPITEILTSASAVTTQSTFSEISDNFSTLPSSIYMTAPTSKDYGVIYKRFLDTPENVAVIGLLTSAFGIGAIFTVAYLMKKRCKNVSVASGEAVDEEENRQDSEENVIY